MLDQLPHETVRGFAGKRRIGLGCMALTGIYGRIDRVDAIAVIHRARDLGINHFDTAELYGSYVNEELLAEALGPRRADVQIATKFGYRLKDGMIAGLDSRSATIRRSVEGSLRRLRCERIDLLYQHRVDPAVPIEDVVGTMADLASEGKVAALGLSAIDGATLNRARKSTPLLRYRTSISELRDAIWIIYGCHVQDALRHQCADPGRATICDPIDEAEF